MRDTEYIESRCFHTGVVPLKEGSQRSIDWPFHEWVPNISNSRPSVSLFMRVIVRKHSLFQHCYATGQLHCFNLSISNYFLTTDWIELCSSFSLIHIRSSPFHCCGQFMFDALLSRTNFSLWGEPKLFPGISPDQVWRHCASLARPSLAQTLSPRHIL